MLSMLIRSQSLEASVSVLILAGFDAYDWVISSFRRRCVGRLDHRTPLGLGGQASRVLTT
ncbi:MAG TPA: hypothetical protein VFD90_04275 [Gaiellales bacterium]|jgi:hypothetical protein|nr:hypothetical protein [Gaiellales bacterium]